MSLAAILATYLARSLARSVATSVATSLGVYLARSLAMSIGSYLATSHAFLSVDLLPYLSLYRYIVSPWVCICGQQSPIHALLHPRLPAASIMHMIAPNI